MLCDDKKDQLTAKQLIYMRQTQINQSQSYNLISQRRLILFLVTLRSPHKFFTNFYKMASNTSIGCFVSS